MIGVNWRIVVAFDICVPCHATGIMGHAVCYECQGKGKRWDAGIFESTALDGGFTSGHWIDPIREGPKPIFHGAGSLAARMMQKRGPPKH